MPTPKINRVPIILVSSRLFSLQSSLSPRPVESKAQSSAAPAAEMPPAAKRKKWTEAEERTLIDKYSELHSSGVLSRLRTRVKKFRPIADHVTAAHHAVDPSAYPFPWSWKDACTKVQNMRHQYLLVKQKLTAAAQSDERDSSLPVEDSINWTDGLSLWPNFLRYRQVFGDAPLPAKPLDSSSTAVAVGDLGLGLGFDGEGFDYNDDDAGPAEPPAEAAEEKPEKMKRKRKKKEDKARILEEREWEERMDRRRAEWRKRVEEMLGQHRVQMAQIQARILNEQQAVIGQLLGIVSHWAGGGGGPGGVSVSGDLAHMNGMAAAVMGENRGSGDGQEDQFILDG